MQIVPPFGLIAMHELGDVDADVVVVRADIGDAQTLVLVATGRSPRSEPGCSRPLGALQRIGHGRRVGRRDGDAVDLLGDEVGDDLRLLVAAAVLAGADVEALDRAVELLLGLLAAGERLVEERVVGVLRHEREGVFLVRCARADAESASSAPAATAPVRQ